MGIKFKIKSANSYNTITIILIEVVRILTRSYLYKLEG